MWEYRANVHRVIDGDTVEVDVDLGFHARVRIPIRLKGVWAPERFTETGPLATDNLLMLTMYPEAVGPWPLRLVSERRAGDVAEVMTFARYVGTLYDVRTGESINEKQQRFCESLKG